MAICPGMDEDEAPGSREISRPADVWRVLEEGGEPPHDDAAASRQALLHAYATPIGGMMLVAGLVMIVLPGPSLPLLGGGLVLLSREYEWARRVLGVVKRRMPFTPRKATKALPSEGLTPRQTA